MNLKMKNIKSSDYEINISVIGLSGNERIKGVRGVGKSCLCNRLAQPSHYKTKHSSVVSSIDLYGSEINDLQWLNWGSIDHEIHNRKYKFKFIEQTVMVDDVSHRAVAIKDDYVSRATAAELRVTKQVHTMGPAVSKVPYLSGKIQIHFFLLVYDVSDVEGRDSNTQDNIFRLLFDRLIQSKRHLIVITTKHDQSSPTIISRLSAILDKRPYSKYPVIETSANINVNINTIFEVVVTLTEGGLKSLKQRSFSYQESYLAYSARLEQCRNDVKKVLISVLDSELWHSSWSELRKVAIIDTWVNNLGFEIVMTTFDEVRMDVRLKRRIQNQQRHKENLLHLLEHFNHLLPSTYNNIATVVKDLMNDKDFMGNFISFHRDAEYFDFNENPELLPLYLLDHTSENNLIFVIKEYIDQKSVEDQLFNRLIINCPENFKKSAKMIGDDLRHYMKHFIPDRIIQRTRERFQKYYLKSLEDKFLEILQENPELFWSQGIFKLIDINPERPWKINGLSKAKSAKELTHDNTAFLSRMVKEINLNILFPYLSVTDDHENVRESWICDYLNFLLSPNEFDCIYRQVTNSPCSYMVMSEVLLDTGLAMENNLMNPQHMFYLVVVGDHFMKSQLTDVIKSSRIKLNLELCKLHSTMYELQLLDNIDLVKDVVKELNANGDKCCSICILICADNDQLVNMKEVSLLERSINYKLTKYMVYGVMEELIRMAPFEGSLEGFQQEVVVIHISTLLTTLKRETEPSIIWVVTVCGDFYDYNNLINDLIKVLKFHSIPKRMTSDVPSITGSFTSKDIDRHSYRLCFISYHQAIKLFIKSAAPPHIDGMLLVCSLDRKASLNSCIGIRKYLPKELRLFCHCMLLGMVVDNGVLLEKATKKCNKHGMKFICLTPDNYKINTQSLSYEMECELLKFFLNIFKGTPITESLEDISTSTSSFRNQNENKTDELGNYLNQYRCKSCGQCKSNENVNSSFRLSGFHHDVIYDFSGGDQVLGDTNENLFNSVVPEFKFHVAQDTCNMCTEVKCSVHVPQDTVEHNFQPFRTRIRSQSGPDLRNLSDSNKSSSIKSNGSLIYCSSCGAKLSLSTEHSVSRKPLISKSSLDKDSPSKKLANIIQDMFSPSKKLNDIQSQEQRKTFVRAASKRRK